VTELRRGPTIGVCPWCGRRAAPEEEATQPLARVREGGRRRGCGLVGRLSQQGRFGAKLPMGKKKIEINFEFDFLF
jgi:hypothetical protein